MENLIQENKHCMLLSVDNHGEWWWTLYLKGQYRDNLEENINGVRNYNVYTKPKYFILVTVYKLLDFLEIDLWKKKSF